MDHILYQQYRVIVDDAIFTNPDLTFNIINQYMPIKHLKNLEKMKLIYKEAVLMNDTQLANLLFEKFEDHLK